MNQFSHGGDIKSYAQNLNCSVDEVCDLSSNINFLKPRISLDFNSLDISSYPSYDELYGALSKKYGVSFEMMEIFNGGSSAIFSLFSHLKLQKCVIYSPAYLEYKKAAHIFGYETQLINRFKNIYESVEKSSLVIFVNPSTPDGKVYDIEALFKSWVEADATVLVDESFLDFTPHESVTKYLKEYEKLYILKSLTKFYSSAGIRVGLILSNEKNIATIKKSEPLWKISQFDSYYIQEALKDSEFEKITKSVTDENREYLVSELFSHEVVEKVHESCANYILIKLKNMSAQKLQEILNEEKIMIRDCSNFDFLDESHVRVAVKSKESIDKFLRVLEGCK